MATPRTIKLPWQGNGRGGLQLTALRDQGAEATHQLIELSVLPPGKTLHPWLQNKGLPETMVFADPIKAQVDVTARLREVFARHRARDRARLIMGSIKFAKVEGQPGRYTLDFEYEDLRRKEIRRASVEVPR